MAINSQDFKLPSLTVFSLESSNEKCMDKATSLRIKRYSRPTFPVRFNKRHRLKSLSQLNGDHLPTLRKPICSEFSQNLKSTNMSVTCNLEKRLQVIHREKTINDVRLRKSQTFIETSKNKINQSMKKLREENWTKKHEAKGCQEVPEWRDLASASVRANIRRERLLLIEQIHKDKSKSKLGQFYNQVEEHKIELEKSKTFMPSLQSKRKESGLDSLIAFSKAITAFMNYEKKPRTGEENSPEALRRCKYLRIYEKRTEEVEKPTSIK